MPPSMACSNRRCDSSSSATDYIKQQGPVQYLEARLEGVTIDEAKAVLTVRTLIRINYPPLDQRKHEIVVRDAWVKRQGEWYRVHPQASDVVSTWDASWRVRRCLPPQRGSSRKGMGEETSSSEQPRHRKEVRGARQEAR